VLLTLCCSEVVGGGVIPTQSSSSHVRHATQYGNHDECRIKQQENEKRLEELLSRISKLESSYATMQSSYATMQSSYATMQSSHATMQALHATMQAQLDSILLHIRGLENLA
jgi:chromosome segregation ATPase